MRGAMVEIGVGEDTRKIVADRFEKVRPLIGARLVTATHI